MSSELIAVKGFAAQWVVVELALLWQLLVVVANAEGTNHHRGSALVLPPHEHGDHLRLVLLVAVGGLHPCTRFEPRRAFDFWLGFGDVRHERLALRGTRSPLLGGKRIGRLVPAVVRLHRRRPVAN